MHYILMQIESDKSSRWLIRRRVWPQSAAYAGAPPRPTFTTVKATDFVFFLRFFPLIFSAMLIFVIDISRCGQLLLLQSLLQTRPAQADQVNDNTTLVKLFTNEPCLGTWDFKICLLFASRLDVSIVLMTNLSNLISSLIALLCPMRELCLLWE